MTKGTKSWSVVWKKKIAKKRSNHKTFGENQSKGGACKSAQSYKDLETTLEPFEDEKLISLI